MKMIKTMKLYSVCETCGAVYLKRFIGDDSHSCGDGSG